MPLSHSSPGTMTAAGAGWAASGADLRARPLFQRKKRRSSQDNAWDLEMEKADERLSSGPGGWGRRIKSSTSPRRCHRFFESKLCPSVRRRSEIPRIRSWSPPASPRLVSTGPLRSVEAQAAQDPPGQSDGHVSGRVREAKFVTDSCPAPGTSGNIDEAQDEPPETELHPEPEIEAEAVVAVDRLIWNRAQSLPDILTPQVAQTSPWTGRRIRFAKNLAIPIRDDTRATTSQTKVSKTSERPRLDVSPNTGVDVGVAGEVAKSIALILVGIYGIFGYLISVLASGVITSLPVWLLAQDQARTRWRQHARPRPKLHQHIDHGVSSNDTVLHDSTIKNFSRAENTLSPSSSHDSSEKESTFSDTTESSLSVCTPDRDFDFSFGSEHTKNAS